MVAVYDIIDYKQAIILWKTHRRDFALLIICFVATLAIGMNEDGDERRSNEIEFFDYVVVSRRGSEEREEITQFVY